MKLLIICITRICNCLFRHFRAVVIHLTWKSTVGFVTSSNCPS